MVQTEKLKQLSTNQLLDVVRNYKQYGYTDELRETAISLLEEQGYGRDRLKLTGHMENVNHRKAKELYDSFMSNMQWALILYIAGFILLTINNTITAVSGIICIISMYLFFIRAIMCEDDFDKQVDPSRPSQSPMQFVILFFGGFIFIILFFYYRSKMKEKLATLTR